MKYCEGKTNDNKKCKNMTENKYCWMHKKGGSSCGSSRMHKKKGGKSYGSRMYKKK